MPLSSTSRPASARHWTSQALMPNPVERPLPTIPADPASSPGLCLIRPSAPRPRPARVDHRRPADEAGAYSARLTLDLTASVTRWLQTLAYVLLFVLTLLLVDSPNA